MAYSKTKTDTYLQESMNDSWNPFDRIIENPEYPLARIYRRSFWSSIADTFDVIVGNHYRYGEDQKTHAGFLDLLIFPLLSQWLMQIARPRYKLIKQAPREWEKIVNGYVIIEIPGTMPLPICILAGTCAYILEGIRGILGVALTLLVLPIVAFVQTLTLYKANTLKNSAKKVEINDECHGTRTLEESLKKKFMNLDDISIDESAKKIKGLRYIIGEGSKFESGFTLFSDPKNKNQSVEAFKELNIGAKVFR